MKVLSMLMLVVLFSSICICAPADAATFIEKRVFGGYEERNRSIIEWHALILRNGTSNFVWIKIPKTPTRPNTCAQVKCYAPAHY